jgi:corrinoid protein of di/trimethylamine methyltransferase
MTAENEHLVAMAQAIIDGNSAEAASLARWALEGKLDLPGVIEKGFIPGIQKVGELWEQGEYFLPELLAGAEAMKAAMAILKPALEVGDSKNLSRGRVVIGTVEGDIHDIGKNLVASMLSANGFEVTDLGADVKLDRFIENALASGADLICLSALLTTTMLGQRRLIDLLVERGLRGRFKVMVGGAPATQKWATDIGADGYGENAQAAVRVAKKLLEKE